MTTRDIMVIAGMIALSMTACNQRSPVLDREVLVTAPTYAQVPPVPSVSAISVQFDPVAVFAGAAARGTVTLNSPADGASVLTLSAAGGAVDLSPAQVVVPAGARQVSFTATARNVSSDVNVNVIASMNGLSASTTLPVWAVLPTFFSYFSDPTHRTDPGGVARFTPQNSTIEAYCYRSLIVGWIVPPPGSSFAYWAFNFGAPDGQPLRAGTYQTSGTDSRTTHFLVARIQEPTIFCTPFGRFTVNEIELAPAPSQQIRRLSITFEQSCQGGGGPLRGELRLTNVNPLADATPSSCFR